MDTIVAGSSNVATGIPLEIAPSIASSLGAILVVEDETFVREVTCEVLRWAGYQVWQARHGVEATSIFRDHGHNIRLLLTDVVLPGQNGCNLAQQFRTTRPDLKAIFTSGYPKNAISPDGVHPSGTFYLPKPFSVQSLLQIVKDTLSEEKSATRACGTG
jgi:two-component system cell cycle sensor histidine kinase/response regulator CckA